MLHRSDLLPSIAYINRRPAIHMTWWTYCVADEGRYKDLPNWATASLGYMHPCIAADGSARARSRSGFSETWQIGGPSQVRLIFKDSQPCPLRLWSLSHEAFVRARYGIVTWTTGPGSQSNRMGTYPNRPYVCATITAIKRALKLAARELLRVIG